jgi:hypothetical protein
MGESAGVESSSTAPHRLSGDATRWRRWALAAWVVFAAAAVWKLRAHALDDFFITYRFAENLANGRGFAFNPGEHAFVTSAPGWALLLGLLRWATRLPVPMLGMVGSGAAWLAIAWLVAQEADERGRASEGLAAGTLLVTSVPLWTHGGSELPAALAAVLVGARLAAARPVAAGLLAGLAAWLRPDFALAVPLLALGLRRDRGPAARYLATSGLLIAAGLLAAKSRFGTFLPVTAAAKRAHAALDPTTWPSGLAFWPAGWRFVRDAYAGAAIWLFVALAALGCVVAWRRGGPAMRTLLALAGVLALVYPLLGVPFFTWYALPQLAAATVAASYAAGALVRRAAEVRSGFRGPLLGVALVVALAWPIGHLARSAAGMSQPFVFPLGEAYRETGEWLAAHARPGDEVSAVEVGEIAFYGGIPMRDLLGLTSPENLPSFLSGGTRAVLAGRPTRFLVWPSHLDRKLDPLAGAAALAVRYRVSATIARGGLRITLFVRADSPLAVAAEEGRDLGLGDLAAGDAFDELRQRLRRARDLRPVHPQEDERRRERAALVAVDERVIAGEVEEIGRRLLLEGGVEKLAFERGARRRDRRGQESGVSQPGSSTVAPDLIGVQRQDLVELEKQRHYFASRRKTPA